MKEGVISTAPRVLTYLHGDHLGSTSLATDASGNVVSQQRYKPYGELRWASGAGMPTDPSTDRITGPLRAGFTFTLRLRSGQAGQAKIVHRRSFNLSRHGRVGHMRAAIFGGPPSPQKNRGPLVSNSSAKTTQSFQILHSLKTTIPVKPAYQRSSPPQSGCACHIEVLNFQPHGYPPTQKVEHDRSARRDAHRTASHQPQQMCSPRHPV